MCIYCGEAVQELHGCKDQVARNVRCQDCVDRQHDGSVTGLQEVSLGYTSMSLIHKKIVACVHFLYRLFLAIHWLCAHYDSLTVLAFIHFTY